MTSLIRRASICAGIAVLRFSALSEAQSTETVVPERAPVLRRALPVAAAPIVQQSPNGLYKLSITDTGIELIGPRGGVKITDAGIEIGAPKHHDCRHQGRQHGGQERPNRAAGIRHNHGDSGRVNHGH